MIMNILFVNRSKRKFVSHLNFLIVIIITMMSFLFFDGYLKSKFDTHIYITKKQSPASATIAVS